MQAIPKVKVYIGICLHAGLCVNNFQEIERLLKLEYAATCTTFIVETGIDTRKCNKCLIFPFGLLSNKERIVTVHKYLVNSLSLYEKLFKFEYVNCVKAFFFVQSLNPLETVSNGGVI